MKSPSIMLIGVVFIILWVSGLLYLNYLTMTEVSSYQDAISIVTKETLSQINTNTNGSDLVKIIERNCDTYVNNSFTVNRNNQCKRDMIEKAFAGISKR